MATWNDALQDEIIEAQTDLMRLASATAEDLIEILDRTDAAIKAILLDLEISGAVTDAQYAEIRRAQEQIAKLRAEAWGQLSIDLDDAVSKIAIASQDGVIAAILTATDGAIKPQVVATSSLISIASSRPFEGRLLSEWAAKLQADDVARFARTIQLGMVQGQGPAQIARDLFGDGGTASISRRSVEAVVRTAINHVASDAQALFVAQNPYIKKEMYAATLDGRTTLICASHDGKVFDAGTGPRPPLHYNCRSRRVPFLSVEYLAGDRPEVEATDSLARKAYVDAGKPKGGFERFRRQYFRERVGSVPKATSYGDWLKRRSAAFQDDVLGPARAKLFREGGLRIDQFTTAGGRRLTLDELRRKHKRAFERAGL